LSACETHRFAADQKMGFAALNPSYELLRATNWVQPTFSKAPVRDHLSLNRSRSLPLCFVT
jgi:hypothetical protein